MGNVHDSRRQAQVIYAGPFLLWMGLLLFLLKLGSRRQLRFELDSPEALKNLNRLAGCSMETMAHSDTLAHFLGHVPPGQYARVRRKMVFRLVRMKALDKARLFGHFLVVIDGTGQYYFSQRHCEHCLVRTVKGKQQYYHHVLEAKLVTPEGLAVSQYKSSISAMISSESNPLTLRTIGNASLSWGNLSGISCLAVNTNWTLRLENASKFLLNRSISRVGLT